MNNNNNLNLKRGPNGRVLNLVDVGEVFMPCAAKLADAKVLDVNDDGSISVHFQSNFNLDRDFRSELMRFDSNLQLDKLDFDQRNQARVDAGLMPLD